jgi:hypothetical protein
VALVDVDPDEAGEVLGREGQLRPVLAAVVVALVCRGAAEAESETDDEAENGEQELVDTDWRPLAGIGFSRLRKRTVVDKLRDQRNHTRPSCHEQKR